MASYKEQEVDPPLPPLTAQHVFDWLMEAGPVDTGGMGPAPISWVTIDAWAARTFKRPMAWESLLLKRLSAEYLSEMHAAEEHTRPPPWSPTRAEVNLEAQERQLRSVLG